MASSSNTAVNLCSGYGKYHSEEHSTSPRPYSTVTIRQISEMIDSPSDVPKDKAQWVIYSSLLSRKQAEQNGSGGFHALWIDIDEHTQESKLLGVLSTLGCGYLYYSSKSSTVDHQKMRCVLPLDKPISGVDYKIYAKVLNNHFEALGITPDRKTERCSQLCYLPNRGDFYVSGKSSDLPWLDCESKFKDEYLEIKDEIKQSEELKAIKHQQAIDKARVLKNADGRIDVIAACNKSFCLQGLLDKYGYEQHGNKWLSPFSQSGSPGVSISEDGGKWFSSHGSDVAKGIGNTSEGGCFGDKFDLIKFFEYGNDQAAALSGLSDTLKGDNGESLHEINRRAFLQNKASPHSNGVDGFAALDTPLDKDIFKHLDTTHQKTRTVKKLKNTVENIECLLNGYGIVVTYDDLLKRQNITFPNSHAIDDTLGANAKLSRLVSLCSLNGMGQNAANDFLPVLYEQNRINPVLSYIKSKPWDKVDRLTKAIDSVQTTDSNDYKTKVITMWLVQCVAALDKAQKSPIKNAQPKYESVLVLQGAQGKGKTDWIKSLMPKEYSNYIKEGTHLDPVVLRLQVIIWGFREVVLILFFCLTHISKATLELLLMGIIKHWH